MYQFFWEGGGYKALSLLGYPADPGASPTSCGGLWGTWVRHLLCLCLGLVSTWWVSLVHWVPPGKGTFLLKAWQAVAVSCTHLCWAELTWVIIQWCWCSKLCWGNKWDRRVCWGHHHPKTKWWAVVFTFKQSYGNWRCEYFSTQLLEPRGGSDLEYAMQVPFWICRAGAHCPAQVEIL